MFDSVVEQLSITGNIDKDTKSIIDTLNKTYAAAQGTAGTVTTYTVNSAAMAIGQIVDAKNNTINKLKKSHPYSENLHLPTQQKPALYRQY